MRIDAEDVRYFHVLADGKTLVRARQELEVDRWYEQDPLANVPEIDALRHILSSNIRLQSDDLLVHEEATLGGAGIAVMPTFLACRHQSLVRVLPAQVTCTGRCWAVLPTAQLGWEVTGKVLRFLQDAVADAGLTPPAERTHR